MSIASTVLRSRTVAALASPQGVDHYLERLNPMWAAHQVRARVVDVRRETTGAAAVATITLEPTETWRGHRAGQYVQVGVDLPGSRRTTRCFSISSAASLPGETIQLTVRAQDEIPGRRSVSRFLVHDARPGLLLHLSQAEGDFVQHESAATPTNNHLLLVTGGSGITPAMSMVRTLLRDGYDGRANRRVTFLHYAHGPEDQIFAAELAEIAAADNHVDVHLVHTGAGGARFSGIELARIVPDFRDVDTWACGPGGLMQRIRTAYADSPRLRIEHFKPPSLAEGATETAEGTVAFRRSGASGDNTGASLLEQAEALGLRPESGCRMGICFSCTSRKSEGTVRNIRTGVESSQPDEDIQICVSAPVGSCTVDL